MNWRNIIFRINKGTAVKEKRKIVSTILSNTALAFKEKEHTLTSLLSFAANNSTYYKNNVKESNAKLIQNFPVINKSVVLDNIDLIMTQPTKGLRKMSTSGSTGTPFTVYQDNVKVNRNYADVLSFYELGNYTFGEKMYYFRSWKGSEKNKLYTFLTNIVMEETTDLSPEYIKSFLSKLEQDKAIKIIWAYASTLTAIANYLGDVDLSDKIHVKSIFSGSEALPTLTKSRIKKIFGCPVFSRYSNQEMGMLAQQIDNSDDFTLNTASYYFEFLELNSDKPSLEGEPSRIVVTDLFNYAMPLIRYDTGDIGVWKQKQGHVVLESIQGRKTDFIYNTTGNMISPHSISKMMWEVENIKQFQFIQQGQKEYEILINTPYKIDTTDIISRVQSMIGKDSVVKITFVDEIPVLSSGKRRYIINNFVNN